MRGAASWCLLLLAACGDAHVEGNGPATPAFVAPCDAELEYFEARVWEPTLSVLCIGCHNEAGPAKGSRMVLWPESRAGYLEHNFEQAFAVATSGSQAQPLLLLMPTNTNPERAHPGGELFNRESEAYAQLSGLVSRVWTEACDEMDAPIDCTAAAPGPRLLRRLTPTEYDNTIQTLFGLVSQHGATFPADEIVDGFRNNAESLTVTALMADTLQRAAESIADEVDISPWLSCSVAAPTPTCAEDFVTGVGALIFRRPLTVDEVTRYQELYAAVEGFEAGSRLVITAMLQSPHFLYRSELGTAQSDGGYALSDWEIASELSYLIWQTMPDATLFAAAQASELHTEAQIDAQVTRMLADPRARPMFRQFIAQWLGLDRVLTVPRDNVAFPELDQGLRAALVAEADRLIDRVVFEQNGTLSDLLTTPMSELDSQLAELYGVDTAGLTRNDNGFYDVDLTSQQRSGLLTVGASMLAHARSNASSPVHRGRFVRERLLCQVPPAPPPGLNVQPPAIDPSLTARERYAAHSVMEPCRSCHQLMDPIGFAFEKFDGIGRYRETENGHAIDVSGEILRSENTNATFEGTAELASLLADSVDVQECFARQSFRFGYGLRDSNAMACAVEQVRAEIDAESYSIQSMVTALAHGAHFTRRASASALPGEQPNTDGGTMMPSENDAAMPTVDTGTAIEPTGMVLERVQNDDWGTGYCHGYRLTNHTSSVAAWTITLLVDGTISNAWESNRDADHGEVTFVGTDTNATLPVGGSVQFGFCATR